MRFSSVFWAGVILAAAAMLYSVKYQVQAMDTEIASLRAQIDKERTSLQVLQAEWAFLSRPERVRQLSDKYLDMEPVGGAKLLDMADIPNLSRSEVQLAGAEEEEAGVVVKPVALQAAEGGNGAR